MRQNPYGPHVFLNERYCYFYDVELKDFSEDLRFYKRHIPKNARNILELGCGTGRIALALARAGYAVTGIDLSYPMLRRAGMEHGAIGGHRHLHLVCMDMVQMGFRTQFDAILIPYNTLNMLTERIWLRGCLDLCRRFLRRSGRLIMDLFTPDRRHMHLDGKRLLQFKNLQSPDGDTIRKELSEAYDPKTCLMDMAETYRVYQAPAKAPQEVYHYEYQLIALSCRDWEDLLGKSGFMIEQTYGDYALNPYVRWESTKMLVVAMLEQKEDKE